MKTRLHTVGIPTEDDPIFIEAARLLKAGELVAFPTETVYGLGADACNPDAVAKIFEAKNRPNDNPLIVHISDVSQVNQFAMRMSPYIMVLAEAFWPGPLTIVVKAHERVKNTVCRGLETVALRIPDHPIALTLIRKAKMGLAAPSANLSGKPSPTKALHVYQDMSGRIPLILDGGSCRVGIESTVLDLSQDAPCVLRPGVITAKDIERILGCPVHQASDDLAKTRSPGTRYRHYSPEAQVYLVSPAVSKIAFQRLLDYLEQKKLMYVGKRDVPANLRTFPNNELTEQLYAILRQSDEEGLDAVVIDGLEEEGVAQPLMDRLLKASSQYFGNDNDLLKFLRSKLS